MHRDYWVAIGFYVATVILIALPFFGIVQLDLGIRYPTLKFLHIVSVVLVIAGLAGQMIAFFMLDRFNAITQELVEALSVLDYVTPVGLSLISVFGYGMAFQLGPIWQHDWVYESAFGALVYASVSLVMTIIFKRKRFFQEGGSQSVVGVYIAGGTGVGIYGLIIWVMVTKTVPIPSSAPFIAVSQHLAKIFL